jgi:hypothetical protein
VAGLEVLALPQGYSHSYAFGVNTQGIIVGHAELPVPPGTPVYGHAIRWDAEGKAHNLNDAIDPASGWALIDATSITNDGRIVGNGRISGERRGYLLTPLSSAPPADDPPPVVEEPKPRDGVFAFVCSRRNLPICAQ